MATAAKKKTKKGKLFLEDYLGKDEVQPNMVKKTLDWATEMEDEKIETTVTYGSVTVNTVYLPTAPRSAYDIEDLTKIPDKPPFTVQLRNLPYEVTQEQIARFLENIKCKDIKLPNRDRAKPSGVAYVTCENREDLIEALKKSNEKLMGREIQIQVPASDHTRTNATGQQNSYGSGYKQYNNTSSPATETGPTSWRSTGIPMSNTSAPSREPYNRRSSYKDDYSSGPNRTRNYEYPSSGGNMNNVRRPYAGSASTEYFRKNSYPSSSQQQQQQQGNSRYDSSSAFPPNPLLRQPYDKTDSGSSFVPYPMNQHRQSFNHQPGLDSSMERLELTNAQGLPLTGRQSISGGGGEPEAQTRTKLELKPRSVDKKVPGSDEAPPAADVKGKSYAAIFGGAKPVDTSGVERAIEEKLLKQQQVSGGGGGGANFTNHHGNNMGGGGKDRIGAGEKIISRSASLASFGHGSDDGLQTTNQPRNINYPHPAPLPPHGPANDGSAGSSWKASGGPQPLLPHGLGMYASASSLTSPPSHKGAVGVVPYGAGGAGGEYRPPPYQPPHYAGEHPDEPSQYSMGRPSQNYRPYPRDPNFSGMPPMPPPPDHYATAPRQGGRPARPYHGAKSMDYHSQARGNANSAFCPPPMPVNARLNNRNGPHMLPSHYQGERRQSADTRNVNYEYQQRNMPNKRQPRPPSANAPFYPPRPTSYGNNDEGVGGLEYGSTGRPGSRDAHQNQHSFHANHPSSQPPFNHGGPARTAMPTAHEMDMPDDDLRVDDQTSPYLMNNRNRVRDESSSATDNGGLVYRNKYDTLKNLEDE